MGRGGIVAILLEATLLCGVAAGQSQAGPDPMAVGRRALQQEHWEDAQKFFSDYSRENPNNVEAQYYLGFSEFGLKHYSEAEAVFKKIVAAYPKTWSAHSSLSEVYAAEEKWPEFDRERQLLHDAKRNNETGTQTIGNDVIDVLYVGDQRWIVREYYPLSGRFHARYNFTHFGADGKLDRYISCESDDIDQADFAKRHPKKAAAGERSFSLDSYAGNSQGLILFYSEGEPPYERVRADVLRVATGEARPGSTSEVNGLDVPQQPDVPKSPAPPK